MKKFYLLIIIIILAVILTAVFYQSKNSANPTIQNNNNIPIDKPITQNGDRIFINEADKSCVSDVDCVVISTACGDCGMDIGNKIYTQKYISKLDQFCKNKYPKYPKSGYPACDIDYRYTHEIKCINLKCELSPKQK